MNYIVEKPVGRFPVKTVVTDSDFVEGRTAELVKAGVLVPTDGHPAPVSETDAAGWKRRAESFELENMELRTGTVDQSTLAEIQDLRSENEGLKATIDGLKADHKRLSEGMVTKAEYDNVCDQLRQAQHLIDSAKPAKTKKETA